MKTGFVQLPLERYDQLILENYRLNTELNSSVPLDDYNKLKEQLANIVKIETSWNGEPRLIVNINLLADDLREKFEQSEHTDKWEMKDLSNKTVTIWDTFTEKPQEAIDDQA